MSPAQESKGSRCQGNGFLCTLRKLGTSWQQDGMKGTELVEV